MSADNRIDFSALPFPDVLQTLDFEAELAECKADLLGRYPSVADVIELESEPLVKLLQTFAYRLLLKTSEINAKAKALTLAYASGADLDHLAANRDVYRLLIQSANNNVVPAIPAIYETDEALRRRVQLAPERESAGSQGAYQFWGLSASGDVKDIGVLTPTAGTVDIWVQSNQTSIASASLLNEVATALDPATRRPFTDLLNIKAATPHDWTVDAVLILFPGPDVSVVTAAANAALDKYIEQVGHLGYDVTRSGVIAALFQGGVQNVILNSPVNDIVLNASRYARCTSKSVISTEFRNV